MSDDQAIEGDLFDPAIIGDEGEDLPDFEDEDHEACVNEEDCNELDEITGIDESQDEDDFQVEEESTEEYCNRVAKEYSENHTIKHVHRNIDDFPDSISLGTDGKLGTVKVYFNAANKEEAEQKIINALQLRRMMRDKEAEIEGLAR